MTSKCSTAMFVDPIQCLSLHHDLVLAINTSEKHVLSSCSTISGKEIVTNRSSIIICPDMNSIVADKKYWTIQCMPLSRFTEILATIDAAMGQSLLYDLDKKVTTRHVWQDVVNLPNEIIQKSSLHYILVDLILHSYPVFSDWCNILRKCEPYGIMRFLLSSTQIGDKEKLSINHLSQRYGLSAPYFRQLYRENFKGTAKKKLMDIRLASAILKLIESECSVLDVSIDSGYYSAAHFTTTLKNEIGLTPSEIRRLEKILYEG